MTRITVFCFFLSIVQVMAVDSYAQMTRMSLKVENERLENVFRKIEDESEFFFLYNKDLIDVEQLISVDAQNETINAILDEVLAGKDIAFTVFNRQIVLSNIDMINEIVAQQNPVSGKVTDTRNQPLPGVTVVIKGTTQGTVTNTDGNYTITNVPENATLIFSFVGMRTQEIAVGGQTNINVTLEQDVIGLEEVVAIGYGTIRKSDLTGSVSSVSANEIENIPVQSIDQALRGRVPGLRITKRSGQPGTNSIMQIRGINSIQGGNDPLIIVDGFPLVGGLEFIDPNDITSVEILKDASSTAIYGARASNGVILITTKKGESGIMKIDFDSYYGMQSVTKLIEFANAQEFIKIANARAVNDGEAQLFFPNPSQITVNTNWQEEIFQSAAIQRHNLTLSGGTDRLRFSVSGNYFNQDGVVKSSDFEKFTLRTNIDGEMNKRLRISNSMFVVRSVHNNPGSLLQEAFRSPPTLPVYDTSGNYQDLNIYPFSEVIQNPMALIDGSTNKYAETRFFDNFDATFIITEDLLFKSSIGLDYITSLRDIYQARYLIEGSPGGRASKSNSESYSLLNENIVNYNKEFRNNRIDAVAGYTWQTYRYINFSAGSSNFVSDDLLYNVLDSGSEIHIPSSGGSEWGLVSWIGRVNVSLDDKYLITLSGRADGSSRFSEENKWAFFPSVALAWRLSEEEWIEFNKISNMKLRISAGQAGNQAISPYQTLTRLTAVSVPFGDALNIGYAPANIANKNLKWETTTQYNTGLDIGFVRGRLFLTVDYYYKLTTDLLARVDLPLSAGFTSSTQNIGSMSNQGIEIQMNAKPFTGSFKWDISANYHENKNKVIELYKGVDIFASGPGQHLPSMHIIREGKPLSMFYGYIWDGIDTNGQNVYKDLNEDGRVNDLDRTIIGNPHPKFNIGFNNTFAYKNLQLSVLLESSFKHNILNVSYHEHTDSFYKGRNQLKEVIQDYWTPDNTDAKYPKPSANVRQLPSDRLIEDGSYLKIRHVNLAYSFPVNQINWLTDATVYITGENLFTFTNYTWYDPEVSQFSSGDLRLGVDNLTYPQVRILTIGFKVGF